MFETEFDCQLPESQCCPAKKDSVLLYIMPAKEYKAIVNILIMYLCEDDFPR